MKTHRLILLVPTALLIAAFCVVYIAADDLVPEPVAAVVDPCLAAIHDAIEEAQDELLAIYARLESLQAALRAYRPSMNSTGRCELVLTDSEIEPGAATVTERR